MGSGSRSRSRRRRPTSWKNAGWCFPASRRCSAFSSSRCSTTRSKKKLSEPEQLLHVAAIILVTVAIALVMAPAALHRRSQPREVSARFIHLSSGLLVAGMFRLALGLAFALLTVFAALWLWLPSRERRRK